MTLLDIVQALRMQNRSGDASGSQQQKQNPCPGFSMSGIPLAGTATATKASIIKFNPAASPSVNTVKQGWLLLVAITCFHKL